MKIKKIWEKDKSIFWQWYNLNKETTKKNNMSLNVKVHLNFLSKIECDSKYAEQKFMFISWYLITA